jgi:hypothetical protein
MRLRLSTAESVPVVAGRWITRLALIGVVAVLVMELLQSRRRRGQRHRLIEEGASEREAFGKERLPSRWLAAAQGRGLPRR